MEANKHYYMILFFRDDPENKPYGRTYHVSLVKAPNWFEARKRANAELEKWKPNGWKMDPDAGVGYLDCEKIDAGEVVGLTTI